MFSGMMQGMSGMFPPGVQQLIDALPEPSKLQAAADRLIGTEDHGEVAVFLDLLAQLLLQQGIVDQDQQQTEAWKLECRQCHKQFAVADPINYIDMVTQGTVYACSNNHEAVVLGSGRLGMLSEIEEQSYNKGAKVVSIYPEPPSDATNNTGD